ncbi:esterase/lipase family protein [Undibacterium curvum]|uniref:GPI inositol-deacylase PGAP1-like alpha/beta domain-containing protein n=1 Tax=Undibacterium curvum TaxID=2762294 RepID=A0ABR7A172_9BURK|nr:hypothetical protein [Undibacterium curvum]MBC3930659.1 hypothetical protein [Undibacterium curvum]
MTQSDAVPDNINPNDEWVDFTWGVDGSAQVAVQMTPIKDRSKVRMRIPPAKLIPIVFLPGIMGSNLRMTRSRQQLMERKNNSAWRPDAIKPFDTHDFPAKERQLRLDPDATEVDYYEMTNANGEFDATGDLTESSDKRHSNVPDDLPDIGLLRSDPHTGKVFFSAAQKARARGWSEVMFGSYGDILKLMEAQLNQILETRDGKRQPKKSWLDNNPFLHRGGEVLGRAGFKMGNANLPPIEDEEILKIGECWYPVHAMGYNWLRSNGENAKVLAQRIRDLINNYQQKGRDCPGVILVTHSMGGLLARALIHPDYGNIADKVLGIYHNVMPTVGAAAAYKRMRAGFGGEGSGLVASVVEKELGNNAPKCVAVLANAQGGLELLPFNSYGKHWLKVVDADGKELGSWPAEDAVQEVYTDNQAWWRLINPDWIDPAQQVSKDPSQGGKTAKQIGANATNNRIERARDFSEAIAQTFAKPSYASYGVGNFYPAWGNIVWQVSKGNPVSAGDPKQWTLLSDTGNGTVMVKGVDGQPLSLSIQAPQQLGDGTVPSERSAKRVQAQLCFEQIGYDHQGSYQNSSVQDSTLYSIVKIASAYQPAWWAKPNYKEKP